MNEDKNRPEQETTAPVQPDTTTAESNADEAAPAVTEEAPTAAEKSTSPVEEPAATAKADQTGPVLCSPLIVHKEGDASYQPDTVEDGMTATHTEDELEAPTIERHRFRKKKKNHKGAYVLILLLVAAVAVCAALYFTGTYDFGLKPKETTTQAAKATDTTQETTNYDHVITVKGTYLFYEGQEVDGVEGLIAAIKYEPAGSTFTVQDENANSNFLNNNVLSTLSLYKMNYNITHIVSSGLTSKYETTKAATQAQTTKPSTTAAKSND